ncbi:MAG: metalloregulator ArsR/SmtB family transcription factor [Chthoniobacterales bacterium]|nr:metalloregulator ArsR/SmtB family transcription factor [Chthoniobacterales bacterium]
MPRKPSSAKPQNSSDFSSTFTPRHLSEAARLFSILADESRLSILKSLMQGEKPVGQLAAECNLSQANVSKHLAVLLSGRFVGRRKYRNFVFYKIADPCVQKLCELMCSKIDNDFRTWEYPLHSTPNRPPPTKQPPKKYS